MEGGKKEKAQSGKGEGSRTMGPGLQEARTAPFKPVETRDMRGRKEYESRHEMKMGILRGKACARV